MSGLVAVIALSDGPPVRPEEAAALAHDYTSLRGSSMRTSTVGNERAQVVAFETPEPTRQPSGAWRVTTGTMYPAAPWTDDHHEEHLRAVDGQFCTIAYDAHRDEVLIANDPMGMYALFVAYRRGRQYVSTSALTLARHLRCPASRLGLQTFLLSGYHFGQRTHWDDVRRLDPATCIITSPVRTREASYWRPRIDPSVRSMSLEEASSHSIDTAGTVLRDYLGTSNTWADLTGGYDSRLLCLLLDRAGVNFRTNTRSAPQPDDRVIARQVAAARNWDWFDARLPGRWPVHVPDVLQTALTWGDSQLEVLQLSRVLHAHARLAEAGPQRLLSGGGGEHFQYAGWKSEMIGLGSPTHFDLARWIDTIALKPTFDAVLSGEARQDVRSDLAERLSRWIVPYADEPSTVQLDQLYAYKSTGHFGAYRTADAMCLEAQLPFYFKPVVSVAMSVHHRHRNGHRLLRTIMERLDPEVSEIRTTRGGPARPWDIRRAHRYAPYFVILGKKGINKLTEQATGRTPFPQETTFPWEQAAHGAVLGALGKTGTITWSQMRIAPLLDARYLDALLSAAVRPNFQHSRMLGRVITAELALRASDTVVDT